MKQFIINIKSLLENLMMLYSLTKHLNGTLFQQNPITYLELYQWLKLHGIEKVLTDLKQIWNSHNDYDIETL